MNLTIYNQIKDQLKTGDLLQWRSNSVIGSLIRWKTESDVNHSSLVLRLGEYEGKDRRRFNLEAMEHGTVLNYLSRRLEAFDGECWWYPLCDSWNEKRGFVGEMALSLIGIPYDYGSIMRQVFASVSTEASRLFCSEYCYISYGFTGTAPNPGEMPKLGIFKEGVKL